MLTKRRFIIVPCAIVLVCHNAYGEMKITPRISFEPTGM